MKKSICFVDDDQEEIQRFRENMRDGYIVGAGVGLDNALEELQAVGVRKPNIFLLDLYYGPETPNEMRAQIDAADEKLSAVETDVRGLLGKAGQSPKGGFDLAKQARERFPGVPCVFFSRKAFLQDALQAHEQNLSILEKPDPGPEDKGTTKDKKDEAFRRHRAQIARFVDGVVNSNTWWARKRQKVEGLLTGLTFFLVKVGLDFWKTSHFVAIGVWLAPLALLGYALWPSRS